ncbi:protein KRI1 homolog [Nylanderia fulva]|uniref:protein KRI1 homolog n=1 Tax=Nylanderia fulva TaxID=613905 RepID=UPI0010FAECC3|nr:protein KRI1 homolog [Nylanderia fulva]
MSLFDDNNSDSDGELKINTQYASIYDNFRQKEELHKLKARYGEDAAASDESSDSSLSEDDENIHNPQFDKEFLITLACLKSEDPRIYDEKVKFFSDNIKPGTSEDTEANEQKKKKSTKEKALYLRDYERKIITERDGRFSSSEDEDDAGQKAKSKIHTYSEEQKQLKDSFKHVLKDENEDEDTEFLKIKQKTDAEKHKEEESYKEWLKGQKVKIDPKDEEMLKSLREFWTDPNLDSNEKFLRDYILNNKYMNKESYDTDLEYNQMIHDSDENLSEDEKTIQKQEEFEHKYNFRFEEPDQEFIKRYPRTMEHSMRKKDTRRAQKRAEVRQRKEEVKQRQKEEVKQLKALKRKEIEEKIDKLKEITGDSDIHFDNAFDFDADFDPSEHDKKMKELFNDEYYAGGEDENQKPEFPEIDDELDIEPTWDKYDPTTEKVDMEATSYEESHCEDPDFNMDADYNESRDLQSELIENTKKRKRRRRSKFAELIAKEKPKFDPKQFPSYKEYYDQYYSLDYEDMIGDLPCRFKYRKVVPNDYGLSIEEILMADDKELNKWCPLRKALKHKPDYVEENDVRMYKQKAANEANKQKTFKSLYMNPQEKEETATEQTNTSSKKRRRKKKIEINNPNVKLINNDTIPKKKIMNITENNMQNNSHANKNDEKDEQKKNVVDKNEKRKNKLRADDDTPSLKKMKLDKVKKEDSQIETDNFVKAKNNGKKTSFSMEKSTTSQKKNKFNKTKTGKRKSDNDDPVMSLEAERLKTYGISAKKFKNKLKYGNKKF